MAGTTDSQKDRATKFVRPPVMPEANIKDRNIKAGLYAILRLQMMRNGSLVVVEIEEYTGPNESARQMLKVVDRIRIKWYLVENLQYCV
jgi:hypothetical protein